MKNAYPEMGQKDNRVDEFHWERWVELGNLFFCSKAEALTLVEYQSRFFYGLRSSIPYIYRYYSLTTPACRMPGIPHSTTRDTQPNCSVDLFF